MELTPINADQITPEPPKDGRHFVVLPYRVLKDKRMQIGKLRVLMALCSYARKDGSVWPSIPRIAEDTGYTLSTVSQHITALTAAGYIKVINNSYTVGKRAKPRRIIYNPEQVPDDADYLPEEESQEQQQAEPIEPKESIAEPLADATSLYVCWRTLMQQRYNITPPDEPTLYRRLTYRYTLESFKEAARDHLSATSAPPPSVGVLVR